MYKSIPCISRSPIFDGKRQLLNFFVKCLWGTNLVFFNSWNCGYTKKTGPHIECLIPYLPVYKSTFYGLKRSSKNRPRLVHAVLEIIFLYSEDICPFKSSFWSDIWQIGPDIIYWLTTPWRRELKMCWWHVRSSCPIIMWNWQDIFKIWSDNVRWPTVISSTVHG